MIEHALSVLSCMCVYLHERQNVCFGEKEGEFSITCGKIREKWYECEWRRNECNATLAVIFQCGPRFFSVALGSSVWPWVLQTVLRHNKRVTITVLYYENKLQNANAQEKSSKNFFFTNSSVLHPCKGHVEVWREHLKGRFSLVPQRSGNELFFSFKWRTWSFVLHKNACYKLDVVDGLLWCWSDV